MTGNFCNVVTMIRFPAFKASLKSLEDFFSSIAHTLPNIWSNPVIVSCNCASRLRLSVTITTDVNTGSFVSLCKDARRYAVHAIEFDFPEPAEC